MGVGGGVTPKDRRPNDRQPLLLLLFSRSPATEEEERERRRTGGGGFGAAEGRGRQYHYLRRGREDDQTQILLLAWLDDMERRRSTGGETRELLRLLRREELRCTRQREDGRQPGWCTIPASLHLLLPSSFLLYNGSYSSETVLSIVSRKHSSVHTHRVEGGLKAR